MQTRKGGVLFVLLILAIAGFVITNIKNGFNISQAEALQSRGNVLYVGGSGANNYTKIQNAIDNASNGDTIFVYNGTYYENIIIDKSITLIGEDKDTTIINGGSNGNTVEVITDEVNISCFTIQNSAYTGIDIYYAQYCHIENVIVINHPQYGIMLRNSSNCLIADVNACNNSGYGIYLHGSLNCIIANATTNNNWGGIHVVYSSNNCTIINTTASNNEWCFYLYSSHNCTVVNAIITNSNYGITLSESSNCTITNTFIRNNNKGIWLDLSSNNLIYNNYFNNTVNALDNGYNTWNISKTLGENIIWGGYLGGNHWNDYNGEDTDGDGIGNTNIPYNCGGNIIYGGDFLPLMDSIPTPPRWKNQGQSNSTVEQGKSIILYAQGRDNFALDWAWLATNETGEWQNFTIWNNSWPYFKKLGINNPIESYQMMLIVYKEDGHDDMLNATVDCENHCNENFSDIRFVANDTVTLLPYWIESIGIENGHHYARIWVKTSGDENIYMMYGNPNAKPVSNGTATFPALFYDMSYDPTNDWNYTVAVGDSTHRTHHWVNDFNGGSTLSGARLRYRYKLNSINSRNWASRVWIGLTSGEGTAVYPWGTIDEANSTYICNYYNTDSNANETHPSCRFYSRISYDNVSYSNQQRISDYSEDNYYIGEISFCSSMAKYKLWQDNYTSLLEEWQLTNNIPSSVNKQFFAGGPHNTGDGGTIFEWVNNSNNSSNYLRWKYSGSHYSDTDSWIEYYFYWIFVGKYVSPEPSWNSISLSGKYDSPMRMQGNDEWQWSNFTWRNPSIPAGTKVGWRIYYMDKAGNINCTDTMSFVVTPDVTSPTISNIQGYPNPQYEDGYVNITCNVTDNVAVNVVKVNITYPDGGCINATMANIPGTNTYYYNSTYSTIGIYSYFIWANDTNGLSNFTDASIFIIHKLHTISIFGDGNTEKIIQLGSFGNNQNNGGSDDSSIYIKIPKNVHIINTSMMVEGRLSDEGCFAWDDGYGSWVTSMTEGYWQSFTMKAYKITKISAYYHTHRTNWYYNWWYFHTKLYNEQNNYITGSSSSYYFLGWDYDWYGWATTSYDEILNYNSVYLLKTWGTGSPNVDYAGWYYDMYGYYEGGRTSFNPDHDFNFEIYGKSYPFNVKIDIGNDGDIEWTSGTSDWFSTQETMNGWTQELQEHIDNATPDENGDVIIPIKITTDRYGKIRLSNLFIYYNFLPQLSNGSVIPRFGETNQIFTFNVTYINKDSQPPISINVNISKPGWFLNESMSYVNGNYTAGALFTYSTSLNEEGGYQYSFWTTNGVSSAYIGPFSGPAVGNDTSAPQITDIQSSPNPQFSGGYVNISCNVTDNLLLDEVFVNITYPDGSYENFSITQNKTGITYYCRRMYSQVGTYYYYIWTNDFWNNQNISDVYYFNIISGNVIWINDDFNSSTPGWGIDHFNKIQNGINASIGGETVFVYNGIYNEIVNVSESITVYGENNDKTILYGGFVISSDNVTITNFNITGGYAWDPDGIGKNGTNRVGIFVTTSNNTLFNNRIWNIVGGTGSNGSQYCPDGSNGGMAAGIYIDSVTFYNNISSNIIFSIVGGKGGDGYSIYPGGKGGKGGKSVGIYVKYSKYTNISFNKISNIIGGDGGIGKFYRSGGSGGTGNGITVEYHGNNNINSNIISEINGGNGGNGGYVSPGSNGGNGIGIYIQSQSNSISSNTITIVNGGRGGKGSYYDGGKGGMGIGIYINDSVSIFNNVTSNLIHSIRGGYGFGEYGSVCDGGDGGEGIGLYLLSCASNSIYSNNISSITGGIGGMGDPTDGKKGGGGGIGSGIYISNSSSNDVNLNNISNVTGGRGGTGFSGIGASGGVGSGVYIYNSNFNNISLNNISFIKGGEAGSSSDPGGGGGIGSGIYLFTSNYNNISCNSFIKIYGGKGGSGRFGGCGGIGTGIYFYGSIYNNISYCNFSIVNGGDGGHGYWYNDWRADGADQVGFGFYLENDSFENNIESSNIVDGNPVLFYYNKTGLTIENFHLTANSNPTNLGKIVLISCTNFTIQNNTIANFVGESGRSDKFIGENGYIGSAIFLHNSDLNTIINNTICSIKGGTGGTGCIGGVGGIGTAIFIQNSKSNNITNNFLTTIQGGNPGRGRYGYGNSGNGIGIYLLNSMLNKFSDFELYSILGEFDIGILLKNSDYNTISNYRIYNNSKEGILLISSSYNNILHCHIYNNLFGLSFAHSSIGNYILNCTISCNGGTGIHIDNSSSNNLIYHNNFIKNVLDARDEGSNIWDIGYPNGGNYWDNVIKIDQYHGENQSLIGGDMIVDKPYNVSGGNNQDRYPLMFNTWLTVIYVDDDLGDDPLNHTWNTIQEGINDAEEGNLIFVADGIYQENVVINKTIEIRGNDKNSTIINAEGMGNVVTLIVNGVNLSGFTIRNSGSSNNEAGICIYSNNNTILDCLIYSNNHGINLVNGYNNNLINCTIRSNLQNGIFFNNSTNNSILRCEIFNNSNGISLDHSNNNTVLNCLVSLNDIGIVFNHSSNNKISACSISSNENYGMLIQSSSNNNRIYHNNFVKNAENAYDTCINQWNHNNEGNYWDDYEGYDNDYNGRGDTPYNISGGNNIDAYPLIVKYPHKIIYVDDDFVDDPGLHHWSEIQWGIEDAEDGDTVFVLEGKYSGPFYYGYYLPISQRQPYWDIKIDKSINLIGENRSTTILDGASYDPYWGYLYADIILSVNADNVNISGFSIVNCSNMYEGFGKGGWVEISGKNVTIKDCKIGPSTTPFGYAGNGIYATESKIKMENCIFNGTFLSCILLYNSSNSTLLNCTFIIPHRELPDGGYWKYAVWMNKCSHTTIKNCIWDVEKGDCIRLWKSTNNTIYNCVLRGSISFNLEEGSSYNQITSCNLSGSIQIWGDNNIIYHNNIFRGGSFDNGEDNLWCYNGTGNYWEKYNGEDNDHNGIGDTPYKIGIDNYGVNYDNYPSMFPYPYDIIYVDDDLEDDPLNHTWNTIQEGINDANDRDKIIIVYEGIYDENIQINKTINLIGKNNPIIDGGGNDAIMVNANWVNITGFSIVNATNAINMDQCSHLDIVYCDIYNNQIGINLSDSADNFIRNCNLYNSQVGIQLLDSMNNTITSCAFLGNYHGIKLLSSSNNLFQHNDILNNNYGINSISSSNNKVHWNNITGNINYGVYSSLSIIYCEYNWWGSNSGPSGTGSGNGDKINSNVIYDPYLLAPVGQNQPPIVFINDPGNGQVVSRWVNLKFTIIDYDGWGSRYLYYKIDDSGWKEICLYSVPEVYYWNYSWWNTNEVENGEHTIYAKVRDGTDWSEIVSVTVTVDNPIINQKPIVSITSPSDDETVSGVITITGTASDSDGAIEYVEVKIYPDPFKWEKVIGTESWSYSWNTMACRWQNRYYYIFVRSYDGIDYSPVQGIKVWVSNVGPTITVDPYYHGFFLKNVDIENTYTAYVDPQPDYVKFIMSGDGKTTTIIDNNPSNGWKATFNMGDYGMYPTLTIEAYLGEQVTTYTEHPWIVDTPIWLEYIIDTLSPGIEDIYDGGKRYWQISTYIDVVNFQPGVTLDWPYIGGYYGFKAICSAQIEISSNTNIFELGGYGETGLYLSDQMVYGFQPPRLIGTFRIYNNEIYLEAAITISEDGSIKILSVGIPHVAEIGVDFTYNVGLTVYFGACDDGWNIIPGLKFKNLEGDVGIGIDGYGSVVDGWLIEGRAGGQGHFLFDILPTLRLKEFYLTAHIDVTSLKGGITLYHWDDTYTLWQAMMLQYLLDNENWTIPREEYVTPYYENYSWIPGRTDGRIVKNVYPLSHPSLAIKKNQTGNRTGMIVWVFDDTTKEPVKGFEIRYSLWNNETKTWSMPSLVTNDSLMQIDPVVAFDNNENAVCVFVEIPNATVTNTTPASEAFAQMEIGYSVWNHTSNNWSNIRLLTNNSMMDYSPIISSDDTGNIVLIWRQDNDNNLGTLTDSNIYFTRWNGESWSDPIKVMGNYTITSDPTIACFDNKVVICAPIDIDSNLSTISDTEIGYTVYDPTFNLWQPVNILTHNEKCDTLPSIAFDENGNLSIAWIRKTIQKNNSATNALYYGFIKDNTIKNVTLVSSGNIANPKLLLSYNKTIVCWQDDVKHIPYFASYNNGSWESRRIGNQQLHHSQFSWEIDENNIFYVDIIKPNITALDKCNLIYIAINENDFTPSADFSYSPMNATTAQSIQFSDQSTDTNGEVAEWLWDFGDGIISFNKDPTHRFTDDGVYTVKLTVWDDDFLSDIVVKNITITNVDPVANFSWEPDVPTTQSTMSFIDNSIDSDGAIVSWYWDFGDGNTSSQRNPLHKYQNDGIYQVNLTVVDDDNASSTISKIIQIMNAPPKANFTYISENNLFYFIDCSIDGDGYIMNWTWNFGDGNISYEQNPIHQYIQDGVYPVNLTVTDDDGDNNNCRINITVDVTSPSIVNLQATPVVQDVNKYVNITCNVLDNTEVDLVKVNLIDPNNNTAFILMNRINGVHTYYYNTTYSLPGEYQYQIWTCDIFENENISVISSFTIRDIILPKINTITCYPDPQLANGYVNITCNVTDNVAVNVVKVNITYPNGSFVNETMLHINGTNTYYYNSTYSIAGIYSYFIWVNDTFGNSNKSLVHGFNITLPNVPPIANFSYLPENPTDMDTIQFTDLSYDSDGTIVNWTWNFGDGNISYEENPSHQYADDGIYNVNLTVTDDDGAINSTTKQIIVSNVPPIANFSYLPENPVTTMPVYFTDLSYDLDGNIVSWLWEFGDGKESNIQNPSHQYSNKGIYVVNLTVWDDDGANASITKNITVIKPATDYILITFSTKNEIFDYNISTNFSFIACASAFNNTYGFIEFADANWSITNYGSNGTINVSYRKSILFNSGWNDGTAILTAECNNFNDSVVFNINSGLFSFLLNQGWNLVTLPCENDYNASSLLNDIEGCSIILSWNASVQDFIIYVPGSPYDFPIENGHGYFIGMTHDSIFSLTDIPVENVSIPLYIGWNILGWFKENETTASSLLNNIQGCNIVLRWNASVQDFELYAMGVPDDFVVTRGDGFLVAVSEHSIWHGEC